MKKNIIFASLLLSLQIINAQGPWTKEKNSAYVQLGVTSLFYEEAQLDGTNTALNAKYSDITTQIYSEYGITNKLEALLILPVKFAGVEYKIINKSGSFSGLGNVKLGLKYKISDGKWKISSGFQYHLKTSKIDSETGISTDFDASTFLPYISAGSSNGKVYYFGNIGYGYMSNNFSDYLKIGAEVGFLIIPKGHFIVAFDSKNPIAKESAFNANSTRWPSYLDRQTYNAVGFKFNYEFTKDKYGANIAAFGAFGNDNAPLGASVNLAFYTKL